MGLVSLGSSSFTLSSIAAFKSSTMGWDASRVSAAIPSGVGFIGAGLIWKGKIGIGERANNKERTARRPCDSSTMLSVLMWKSLQLSGIDLIGSTINLCFR